MQYRGCQGHAVEAQAVKVIENFDGYDSPEYYWYNLSSKINAKVTMTDGEEYDIINGNAFYYNNEYIRCSVSSNQSALNEWTVGNTYTATLYVLGYPAEFSVTVVESPVESIEVNPIVLAEYGRGTVMNSGSSDEWFNYRWEDLVEYTIKMKNGEKIIGTGNHVQYNGVGYNFITGDNQWAEHWYVGNTYELTASFLGVTSKVSVSINEKLEENGYEYVLQDNQAVIISCDREDEVLVIPDTLGGYPVVGITDLTQAVEYAKEIVIPDTVTMLSKGIYQWNWTLEKLTLGKGISNLKNEYFTGTECLEEIVISDNNATYKSVDGVVYDKDVTKIEVFPRAKTGTYKVPDTVTDISVLMDNFNLYNVELDLGNSNTDYVMEDGVIYNKEKTVIYKCDQKTTGKYTMPNTVTEIKDGAFEGSSLSEVIVSENVSEIVYCAFSNSEKLENIVLPQKLEEISDGAFDGCTKLKTIDVPDNVTRIGQNAFSYSGLESVTLNANLEIIGWNAFSDSQLKEVVLPDSLTDLGGSAFAHTPLEKVTFGSGIAVIGSSTFYGTNLKTITLPEKVEYVGEYAFAESQLEEVIFLNDSVYIESGAFYNCPMKAVDLKGVTYIGDGAFQGSQLTGIKIPASVTDVTYMSFADSEKLVNIELPEGLNSLDGMAFHNTAWWANQPDGLVYIGDYLYGYKGTMPENTTIEVKEGTRLIADNAFANQLNLKSVTIPASVENIGWEAFRGCLNLEKITISEDNERYYTNAEGTMLFEGEGYWPNWRQVVAVTGIDVWDYEEDVPYGQSLGEWIENFPYDRWVYVQYLNDDYGQETFEVTKDMVSGFDSTVPGKHTLTLNFGKYVAELDYVVGEKPLEPVAVTGVTITKTLSLDSGESKSLEYTVLPADATNKAVTFSSSNPEVATVDTITGEVTAHKEGQAVVTVKTVDGNYTDTCVVTVNCGHNRGYDVPAEESTCTKQGHGAYTVCEDCGDIISGSDALLPLKDHEGGTATCKDKAICSTCFQPYGSYASHELKHYGKVDADHKAEGKQEYWQCDVCDKYFADAEAKTEVAEKDLVISKVPHSYDDSEWKYDEETHWNECECGEKTNVIKHVFDNNCDTKCNVCEYTRTTEHDWSDKWASDGKNHWHECNECHEKKDIVAHEGGKATCQELAKCATCNTAYGEYADHDYTAQAAEAKYLKSVATCKDKAVYYVSCSVCAKASNELTFKHGDVDPKNHQGETELKDVVEAKCNQVGYTGDTYCKDCNAKIADGKEVAKLPHIVETWEVTKEATTKEKGTKSGTCTGCNATLHVETAQLLETGEEVKKTEGLDSKVEMVGDTNITADVVFKAEEVSQTVTEAVKKTIDKAIDTLKEKVEGQTVASIFDLSLILREQATNGELISEKEFELEGTVQVTIPVPSDLLTKYENLQLVHIKDDGTAEILPFTLEDGKATFTTDGFSYYTFVGTEKAPATSEPGPATPNTGDNNRGILCYALMMMLAAGVVAHEMLERERARKRSR